MCKRNITLECYFSVNSRTHRKKIFPFGQGCWRPLPPFRGLTRRKNLGEAYRLNAENDLLQPGVLYFRVLQDGKVGIGVLP